MLLSAFDSNWIAPAGPDLDAFEQELAPWLGRTHVAALSSGTAALHLALLLLGVGVGDEVIVPTLTFVATANAVAYTGAEPAFVDSEPSTMNLDPELLAQELARRAAVCRLPKAVICVDLYGQCAKYEVLEPLCAEYGVPLIEDAAEGLGASRLGRPSGSFGLFGATSFNGNKIVTTSGGGAFASDDAALVERIRYLSTQARQPVAHYEHEDVGYNYRLSNLLAALGRGQLTWLAARIERKRAIRATYLDAFSDIDGLSVSTIDPDNVSNYWLTTVTIDRSVAGIGPEDVRHALEKHHIESRRLWKPLHSQPVFRARQAVLNGTADRAFSNGLCLPSGSSLSEGDQRRVVDAVVGAFRLASKGPKP